MRCNTLSSAALPSPLLWFRASRLTMATMICRLFLIRWPSLLQQRLDTLVRGRVLSLEPLLLGHVFDRHQDLLCVVAGPIDLPCIEHHHSSSNRREDAVHFEGLDRRAFGKDGFDQGAQLGNVPLSVAELIELPADRILWDDCECAAKGTVRKPDRQVGIE